MKKVKVKCTWYTYHEVEVPDEMSCTPTYLSSFPDEALEEMVCENGELVDWEIM